ncbi:MAG: hypothetical protein K0B11_22695 [Mariniphaga sp.]|nr:hypothetical protein [Mariniphaga sp.]
MKKSFNISVRCTFFPNDNLFSANLSAARQVFWYACLPTRQAAPSPRLLAKG